MRNRVVAGIDIGTSKIATIIASIPEEGLPNVIGVASVSSRGIRKGQIVDIDEATSPIVESLEASERMAGYSISSVFLTVGGSHIKSQNSHGVVAVSQPHKEIMREDINRVIDAARAISLPSTREVLHVLPRQFIVDSQEGIKDPAGMTGVRLEVDTHLITAGSTSIRNLEKCASLVGLDVVGFVFGGLVSSTSVLTETEKELGVVLVDIGGGTTGICIYVEGALSYSSVLPVGANHITNDLAIGLRISLESAEKIKLLLNKKPQKVTVPKGDIQKKDNKEQKSSLDEQIDLSPLNLPEGLKKISRKTTFEGIIRPRINEIFSMIGLEIKKSGFGGLTPAGLVITGGGAETVGIVELGRRNLAMQVRVGIPANITGLIDEIMIPSFASAVGLVLYAAKTSYVAKERFFLDRLSNLMGRLPVERVAGRIVDLVKSFLP